jgi:hypothetical protein
VEQSSHSPKPNECCDDSANLIKKDSKREDLDLFVCKVCGSRHFELTVDPTNFALIMNPEAEEDPIEEDSNQELEGSEK